MTNFPLSDDFTELFELFPEWDQDLWRNFERGNETYRFEQLIEFAINNDYLWRKLSAKEVERCIKTVAPKIKRTKQHWEYCSALGVGVEMIAVVPRIDAWLIYRFINFKLEEKINEEGYVSYCNKPDVYSCVYLSDVYKKHLPYCFTIELRDKSLERYTYGRTLLSVPRLLDNRLRNQQEYWVGQDAKDYETEYLKLLK